MKRILLIAFCSSILLFSCKKNSDAPKNTIIATVDGVKKTYIGSWANTINHNEVDTQVIFSGAIFNDKSISVEGLSIDLTTSYTLKQGVYKNDKASYNQLDITYLPVLGTDSTSVAFRSDESGNYPSEVTITSISYKRITGTFSGELLSKDKKTVKSVNGKFNFVIQR